MAAAARSDIASRDRLPSLTGLRFWAAALVVLYHLDRLVGQLAGLDSLVHLGRTGVTFFFVLSGFVLAWTYHGTEYRLRTFWWRRFARIWPLLALTGAASLAVYALLGDPVGFWRAQSTFTGTQALHEPWAAGANPAAWSLSDEAVFYLLFPLLLAAVGARRDLRPAAVATVAAMALIWVALQAAGADPWTLDYFPGTRLLHFALGVIAGVAMRRGTRLGVPFSLAVLVVLAYHAALVPWDAAFSGGEGEPWGPYSGSQWWSALPFCLLIMAAAESDLLGRSTRVAGPWALRLGHWSYAWYLVHEIVIRAWVGLAVEIPTAVAWIALLAITQAVAAGLYTALEHPAERWLRRRGPG